jgi:aminoglycoside 3-N-acetyltransferase
MELSDIFIGLEDAGIRSGDTLMIHGDSIVAAQITSLPAEQRLSALFNQILNYLGKNGTLVVPTFTYSFTKNEIFDVQNSPSCAGQFSEYFRLNYPVFRSYQPIFSVAAVGKYQKVFQESSVRDCFGDGSSFDLLYKLDAKLMNLGCDLMYTFTHYVEQSAGVNYRYFKDFNGYVIDGETRLRKKTRYFVGDLNIKYALKSDKLKEYLISNARVKIVPFGRFASYTVSSVNYFNDVRALLDDDQYSLIEEGKNA